MASKMEADVALRPDLSGDFAPRWQQAYGRVGGMDRVSTVINAIRADRPDALLLDGGDTWHGSYT